MQKLIRKHQWVTMPDSKGISYFGITDFAKDYFLRLDSISHQHHFKTNYGLAYRFRISDWLKQVGHRYKISDFHNMESHLQSITLAQRMEYDRFAIRQDEPFTQLNTVEFDVQLSAPIAMRVLQCNFEAEYDCKIYHCDWLYKVEVLDLQGMSKLLTEKQYAKKDKIIQYEGMLL